MALIRHRPAVPITAALEDAPLPSRGRRWWGIGVALALAVGVGGSRLGWERIERGRLDAERAAWASAGLKLAVSPPRVDPEATAAVQAWSALENETKPIEPTDDPGALSDVFDPNGRELPWSAASVGRVARALENNDVPLRKAAALAAAQRPFHGVAGSAAESGTYPWTLESIVDLAARTSLHRGDDLAFLRELEIDYQLGTAWQTLPTFTQAWPGVRFRRQAAERVLASFDELELPRGSEARELAIRWIQRFGENDPPMHMREAIVATAGQWLRASTLPRGWRPVGGNGDEEGGVALPAWQRPVWWWIRPLWLRNMTGVLAASRADAVAVDQGARAFRQALARSAARLSAQVVTHVEPTDWVVGSTSGLQAADWFSPFEEYVQEAMFERLAAVCLACRLYAIDHGGADPSRLADLVPAYLPCVPIDPYGSAGKVMGYATGGGSRIVYSVFDAWLDGIAAGRYSPLPGEHMRVCNGRPVVARLHPTTQPVRGTLK